MIPVLDARSMRAADAAAIRGGVPSLLLMENAATALVEEIAREFARWRKVVVVCGPGNNGGDGLAAARLLASRGKDVAVFTLTEASAYKGDAAENAARARKAGLTLSALSGSGGLRSLRRALAGADGVVDALFGTGLSRGLAGRAAQSVAAINASGRPVVSADLPSGLSSDSGLLIGPSVQADLTVAFAAAKFCHALAPARERCGALVVRDIGIPAEALRRRKSSLGITEGKDVAAILPGRRRDSHKGDFGRLAIVAGARGKTGAAALAARGALRAGAGLVTVFCPASVEPIVVSALPEAMTRGLSDNGGALGKGAAVELAGALADFDAVAVGPGLGVSPETVAVIKTIFKARLPIVCDADALNAFAGRPQAFSRRAPTVLTPHPGEAARLWGRSTREVQADRLACARFLAKTSRAVVVLKGSGSLIATPSGRITVNPTGTPLMSTAGSGDVLTGALGALLAAGIPADDAAIVAVFLHGAAGESLARSLGDAGLLASELADEIPKVRRRLCRPEFTPGPPHHRLWKS